MAYVAWSRIIALPRSTNDSHFVLRITRSIGESEIPPMTTVPPVTAESSPPKKNPIQTNVGLYSF